MDPVSKRWLILGVKWVLALVVLFFIGWQFLRDFARDEIKSMELHPAWLAASAGLYLLGILPNAWFWRHLFEKFGYSTPLYAAIRAHYIGQLGKYVPGKALALAIRADLVHPYGVP